MSALILDAMDGIVTVDIAGRISPAELEEVLAGILYHLVVWGGGSILCICVDFEGWTAGDPGDSSFQTQAGPLIHKMAVFGRSRWEILGSAFTGKGTRPFPIACFKTGRLAEARAWLRTSVRMKTPL